MKERIITLLCALGAIALFLSLFLPGNAAHLAGNDVPRPTTAERGGNGYYAALQWLDSQHVRARSLRDRFERLAGRAGTPEGNVLIITLPVSADFRPGELRALDRWVRAGNTLIVLAALADNPDWAFSLGNLASGDLRLLTGLDFTVSARERPAGAATLHLLPNRPHAYFEGVHDAVAVSEHPARSWTVKLPAEGFVFALAHERESGEGVLWTRAAGSGRIIVSTLGSVFTDRAVGLGDNARLLANLIGANVKSGGMVLFDDAHQGLGSEYDPAAFYRDPRLYRTIGVLVLLWLLWVLGATRLRVPVATLALPQEAELVRATGDFWHAYSRRPPPPGACSSSS